MASPIHLRLIHLEPQKMLASTGTGELQQNVFDFPGALQGGSVIMKNGGGSKAMAISWFRVCVVAAPGAC